MLHELLINAQTVDEAGDFLNIFTCILQLLSLLQQLAQVHNSPLLPLFHYNLLFHNDGFPQLLLAGVPGRQARSTFYKVEVESSCALDVPGHQVGHGGNLPAGACPQAFEKLGIPGQQVSSGVVWPQASTCWTKYVLLSLGQSQDSFTAVFQALNTWQAPSPARFHNIDP